MNHDSAREINRCLRLFGIRPQKKWGQNYLINRGARKKIISRIGAKEGETIWEIGPGLGALTDLLLENTGRFVLFEIDWKIVKFLETRYAGHKNVRLIPGDFLKKWKIEWEISGKPDKVAGNLPYSSASAIVSSFIEEALIPDKMVFTVQKEMACRMTAKPGMKNYSSFSVLCQSAFQVTRQGDLRPGSFYPEPEVTSTIIELIPVKDRQKPLDKEIFFDLLKSLFVHRRKIIKNNLLAGKRLIKYDPGLLVRACNDEGIDVKSRSEELGVEMIISLSNRLYRLLEERHSGCP